jgi:hypothetical protein
MINHGQNYYHYFNAAIDLLSKVEGLWVVAVPETTVFACAQTGLFWLTELKTLQSRTTLSVGQNKTAQA